MIKASGCAKRHPGWSYSLIMHYGVDKQQSLFKPNNSKHTIRDHLDFAELGKLFNAHVPALLDRQTLEREKVEEWRWWWWWDITQVTSWLRPMVITQYSHYTVSLGIHFNWMILQYMIYPCQCSKTLSLNVIQGLAEFSNATQALITYTRVWNSSILYIIIIWSLLINKCQCLNKKTVLFNKQIMNAFCSTTLRVC